jgi:N utilization substance protein B
VSVASGKRRRAREIVLQVLYEAEFSDLAWEEILDAQVERRSAGAETVEYARSLLTKTQEHLEELDERIRGGLSNWDLERVSLIDRSILRFALAEILYFPDVPSKVIMNEAIEIAHRYSSKDAGQFINGLLDNFVHTLRRDEK